VDGFDGLFSEKGIVAAHVMDSVFVVIEGITVMMVEQCNT
jgi:hypothetical protein